MEAVFILLLTFVTSKEVSAFALRNDTLVEHAAFESIAEFERALVSYASQTNPTMKVEPNRLGQLEAYTSFDHQSKGKVSCLRIILPAQHKSPLS
tara:strand:- start:321 stop:605 length:285 start_codon:yes stop_codon:yes gene_type:complete